MKSMAELIPGADALKRMFRRRDPAPPGTEAMANMKAILDGYGYERENPEVFNAVCSYGALMLEKTDVKGLLLKGECGIGKTAGIDILAARFRLPVFTPSEFAGAWKDLDGHPGKFSDYVVTGGDALGNPRSIVVDEIGVQDTARNYGETLDLMSRVIEARHLAFVRFGVRTLMTTNLSDADIRGRYGVRIVDRLAEMAWSKRVQGRSLRG